MQQYDPASNTWKVVTMPAGFGGSLSAVVANNVVHFCGGIFQGNTITMCGKYDLGSGTFGPMASIPVGVNHPAFATDGNNKIFIVGGR
jgi:hypothetical protein